MLVSTLSTNPIEGKLPLLKARGKNIIIQVALPTITTTTRQKHLI